MGEAHLSQEHDRPQDPPSQDEGEMDLRDEKKRTQRERRGAKVRMNNP